MRYVKFTYVDYKTGVSMAEAPCRNGITTPDGVVPTFDIARTRTSIPEIYGIVEDDSFIIPEGIEEVDESVFFSLFKNELKERTREKRKQVEYEGIEVDDTFIPTTMKDQNRVFNMVQALTNNPELESIDFEYSHGEWTTFSREKGLEIGKAVGRHTQECMSWCRNIHKKIDDMEIDINSLENAMPILEAINNFGMEEQYIPEGEE